MSARIVIELQPSGEPHKVLIGIASEVSDGSTMTNEEIVFTLEQMLQGIRSGTITPLGRHRRGQADHDQN